MDTTPKYHPQKLANLLKTKKIATIDQLKLALGTHVDVTVFRKLKALGYRTSYSHRGRYYTLDQIPRFDHLGLWSYRSVYFSKYGTLLDTAHALVENAEAGYFARELEKLLHVGVKDALLKLTRQGKITRKLTTGKYLYCAADPDKARQQLRSRRLSESSLSQLGPRIQDAVPDDEVRAAILLFLSLLDEQQRRLYAGVESLKWGYGGDRKVAHLLGLDVQTVATGRQQLLKADVQANRVRKPGAGRKSLKKNAPSHRGNL